jgi:redox-sensitive bicupin YhaK (pirin superfamily)
MVKNYDVALKGLAYESLRLVQNPSRNSNFYQSVKGFPMHPHRGIEAVTYMTKGPVNHKGSMRNSGHISGGDV